MMANLLYRVYISLYQQKSCHVQEIYFQCSYFFDDALWQQISFILVQSTLLKCNKVWKNSNQSCYPELGIPQPDCCQKCHNFLLSQCCSALGVTQLSQLASLVCKCLFKTPTTMAKCHPHTTYYETLPKIAKKVHPWRR